MRYAIAKKESTQFLYHHWRRRIDEQVFYDVGRPGVYGTQMTFDGV
jgi:hypothetical protein